MEEPGQRYDPVGSSNDCDLKVERESLENEQEKLATSFQALTTHFAQVQFRLRQIISAPNEQKFNLIENLDEFASRGICNDNDDCLLSAYNQQQVIQIELINKLQSELSAASNFANGNEIDFVMENLNTDVNDEALNATDKDLSHLKTQIFNLDTFVADLRCETVSLKQMTRAMLGGRKSDQIFSTRHENVQTTTSPCQSFRDDVDNPIKEYDGYMQTKPSVRDYKILLNDLRQRPLTESLYSDENPIKCSSSMACHWGNIRAKLEIDVQNIISVVSIAPLETDEFEQSNGITLVLQKEITKLVRKELCGTLRELIEHGLRTTQLKINFFNCCTQRAYKRNEQQPRTTGAQRNTKHAWDIIMEFYHFNDGNEFYTSSGNTLNETFQLKRLSSASTKHQLLKAIGDIINIHVRVNASPNSYFKAFVLFGLNLRKLPLWLSLIFRCADLIEANYADESLVCRPEVADILECLDLLSNYEFNLPIDTSADRFSECGNDLFYS